MPAVSLNDLVRGDNVLQALRRNNPDLVAELFDFLHEVTPLKAHDPIWLARSIVQLALGDWASPAKVVSVIRS